MIELNLSDIIETAEDMIAADYDFFGDYDFDGEFDYE